MTQQATLTLEEEIASLRSQLSERERVLRETRQTIDRLTEAPHVRAQNIRELEEQLDKKRIAFETLDYQQSLIRQAAIYNGTDLHNQFDKEVKRSIQDIKDYEKSIAETRQNHAEQDKIGAVAKRNHQNTEQALLRDISTIKAKLQTLEKQRAEAYTEQGELAYAMCKQRYLDVVQASREKLGAQEQALSHLAAWPHLQQQFLQEHALELHSLSEPTTGIAHIARAAIAYIDALIEYGEELPDMLVQDGVAISELLSLSEQEVLAHDYRGGVDVLQQKRAALLKFV